MTATRLAFGVKRNMRPDQPYNMAIAEFEHNGELARITGTAATVNDDASQFIVDLMAREGISGDRITQLYSERQPSPKWYEYFASNWPNVCVTWSFGPKDDNTMDASVDKLLAQCTNPWWKFW